MKIRTVLIALAFTLASMFVFVLGSVAFASSSIVRLKDAQRGALSLLLDWSDFMSAGQSLLIAPEIPEKLKAAYVAADEKFRKTIAGFGTKASRDLLGQKIADREGNLFKLWATSKGWADKSLESLSALMTEEFIVKAKSSGSGHYLLDNISLLQQAGTLEGKEWFFFNNFQSNFNYLLNSSGLFSGLLKSISTDIGAMTDQKVAQLMALMLAVPLCMLIAATISILIFSRSFSRKLSKIEFALGALASKDFSIPELMEGKDELGQLATHLNKTVGQIGEFFAAVQVAAGKVTTLKDSLSSGSAETASALNEIQENLDSISERFFTLDETIRSSGESIERIGADIATMSLQVEAQTAAVQDASSSIEEVVGSISNVSAVAEERRRKSEDLQRLVADGGEKIGSTNTFIQSIAKDVDAIMETIDIINAVSDQTHILSMNAAIESAHAGDSGKGFAVVAEEIRKLAEMTTENADRIGQSLGLIADKIGSALAASRSGYEAYASINEDMEAFVSAMAEISQSMSEISKGSETILRKTMDIKESTFVLSETSKDLNSRNQVIQRDVRKISDISREALLGIKEIDIGTKEVLGSMVRVETISSESRDRVQDLTEAMAGFRTR